MPSFLKDLSLRRRSKASIKTPEADFSSENSSSNDGSHDKPLQPNKSSSTLSSMFDRASPPTTIFSHRSRSSTHLPGSNGDSTVNGSKTPPPIPSNRPRMPSNQSNRYSLVVRARSSRTLQPCAPTDLPLRRACPPRTATRLLVPPRPPQHWLLESSPCPITPG